MMTTNIRNNFTENSMVGKTTLEGALSEKRLSYTSPDLHVLSSLLHTKSGMGPGFDGVCCISGS